MAIYGEIHLETTFDAGHRIVGHKGKCARLHGHTYRVEVHVGGATKEPGFVVDFGDIKDLVNEWDHRMLLWEEDPFAIHDEEGPAPEVLTGVVLLQFNPTAENMAHDLAIRLAREFDLDYVAVNLWETPKSMARYVVPSGMDVS